MTKAVQESMHLNQYNERAQKKGEIYSQDTKRNQFFKENPSQSENVFPLLLLFYDTPIV